MPTFSWVSVAVVPPPEALSIRPNVPTSADATHVAVRAERQGGLDLGADQHLVRVARQGRRAVRSLGVTRARGTRQTENDCCSRDDLVHSSLGAGRARHATVRSLGCPPPYEGSRSLINNSNLFQTASRCGYRSRYRWLSYPCLPGRARRPKRLRLCTFISTAPLDPR